LGWQLPSPQKPGLPEELLLELDDELLLDEELLLELDDELVVSSPPPPPAEALLVVLVGLPLPVSPPEPPKPPPGMTAPWAQPRKQARVTSSSAAWRRKRRSTGTSQGQRQEGSPMSGTHPPGRTLTRVGQVGARVNTACVRPASLAALLPRRYPARRMFWRTRSFWLAAGAVAYVAFAALQSLEAGLASPPPLARALALLALLGLPVLLALIWSITAPPTRGEDRVDPGARHAARAAATGIAMLLAARTGVGGPAFLALASAGTGLCSIASLVALARITSFGGLMTPPPSARRLEAAAVGALLWTVAVALPAARALAPERYAEVSPLLIEYASTVASLASLGLGIAVALRLRQTRRLELGVAERASAALLLGLAALIIGVLASIVEVSTPERLLPIVTAAAAGSMAASAVTQEATTLSRALRITLSVAALATPVALVAVALTQADLRRAGAVAFLACAFSAGAGLLAPRLSRWLAPEGSRWLEALDAATKAAMNPEPDAALEAALLTLRGAAGRRAAEIGGAALYRISPAEMVTVDRAGFAHTEAAPLPELLVPLCNDEPEQILRVDVARAVQVRRPELRPIVAWLDQREIAAVALVQDELSPVGVLVMPRGTRKAPMTLEEVRGLRALADRLGAVIGVSAALSRSRGRELASRGNVEELVEELAQLKAVMARDEGRLLAVATMLERPARLASYSPAARAAQQQIERLASADRPVTLLTAPGVDAVAWAALAHLASPRRLGPLTLVDGASAEEHELERWRHPLASPLRAASAGSLVLLDAHALPTEVQSYIGAALGDDCGLIVTLPSTVDAVVAAGRMSERLADRLGDRAVALPTLASRSEDLRTLALEYLGRIGVRLQSRPLGLSPQALAALLEHGWPGNDAELHATLLRAALVAEGEVIGTRELERIGFPVARGERSSGELPRIPGAESARKRRSSR
jgi:hypothetical protein